MPLKFPHMSNISCANITQLCMYTYLYEPNAINSVTTSTGIHTFHIIGTYPSINIHATFHIDVPLHFYHSLVHINAKILHTSITKSIKCNIYLPVYCKNMCQHQIYSYKATYVPHAHNRCMSIGQVCQSICHIRCHCNQNCSLHEWVQTDRWTDRWSITA